MATMNALKLTLTREGQRFEISHISYNDLEATYFQDVHKDSKAGFVGLASLIISYAHEGSKKLPHGVRGPKAVISPLRNAIRNKSKWLWDIFNYNDELLPKRAKSENVRCEQSIGYQITELKGFGSENNPRVVLETGIGLEVYVECGRPNSEKEANSEEIEGFRVQILKDYPEIKKLTPRNVAIDLDVVRLGFQKIHVKDGDLKFRGMVRDDRFSLKVKGAYATHVSLIWVELEDAWRADPIYPFKWLDSKSVSDSEAKPLVSIDGNLCHGAETFELDLPKYGFYTVTTSAENACLFCIATENQLSEERFRKVILSIEDALKKSPQPMITYPFGVEFSSSELPVMQRNELALGHPDDTIWSQEVIKNYSGDGHFIKLIYLPIIT